MRTALIVLFLGLMAGIASPRAAGDEKQSSPQDVAKLISRAESIELMSLDPSIEPGKAKGQFLDFGVLGSTAVTDKSAREKLAKSIVDGVESLAPDEKGSCFRPRHGLRVKDGGKLIEIGVCFECHRLEIFVDGKRESTWAISSAPEQQLDAMLTTAKVPLAAKPKKAK